MITDKVNDFRLLPALRAAALTVAAAPLFSVGYVAGALHNLFRWIWAALQAGYYAATEDVGE
jgi:hypothetical protein